MEKQYATIFYKELGVYIVVPSEWPGRAENLVLTLAERIIEQFDYVSPILQINNIPTRLSRCINMLGTYYIFEEVSKNEMMGAFTFNVDVPQNGDSIKIEITSGKNLDNDTWSNNETCVLPDVSRISHQPIFTKLCGNVLSSIDNNKSTVHRRLLRSIKQIHQRKHSCGFPEKH
ncbi:uncharacterized protein LOC130671761 isoform X2 [Microplitis mediator]|uniref:uncharacterized protein LOC130671761 isoform X2 n=1 Tax=Microplitis mediator TaxID=375433 RepID=UPI002552447E|nr:uncharacterized protein LOC130671761 isoform X2 [Microplitis mediator]